jgi:hypothetical protein
MELNDTPGKENSQFMFVKNSNRYKSLYRINLEWQALLLIPNNALKFQPKIFDPVAARTGLRDSEAVAAGFDPFTVEFETSNHKAYYPGAEKLYIRLTGNRTGKELLGSQILGHKLSEVSKRIDVFASAIYNHYQNPGPDIRSFSEMKRLRRGSGQS